MNYLETLEEANRLALQAKALLVKEDADAEDAEQRDKLIKAAVALKNKAAEIKELEGIVAQYNEVKTGRPAPNAVKFDGLGHFLTELFFAQDTRQVRDSNDVHPYFRKERPFRDPQEESEETNTWLARKSNAPNAPMSRKDLVESIGASGGFLVPVEFRPELIAIVYEQNPIRERATVIPMRRRQVQVPSLDQTGTTSGATRQHGGIAASWTEEATAKAETQPSFRQINLVAHKLVCYTEISDELLADEAIGLVGFLQGENGFGGAIRWEEEYTFLQGTGAGQPLGVINAGGTVQVAAQAANAVAPLDLFNMLEAHVPGQDPIWHINRGVMSDILNLNGPAGNPSYIFIQNATERPSMTLFGYPVHWTEKLPALGTSGSVLLANWSWYYIGDRQQLTIDSSMHYRFQYDLTAWRAVHRVDGQPALSAPLTLADGTTQISPFVILGTPAS